MECRECRVAGVARAGAGLPHLEAGTPVPAGTGLTRRRFVLGSIGAAVSVYGMGGLGGGSLAHAAGSNDRVLVSVFLEGGIDALTVLAPTEDPVYRRLRPKLAMPPGTGTPFDSDDRLRWHPSAAALASLHAEGVLAVAPAIGYGAADQSHFTSRHFYEVGKLDPKLRTGWLGRYLDRVGTLDNPLQGFALDNTLSPTLATARVPIASCDKPRQYDMWARGVWGEVEERLMAELASAPSYSDPMLRAVADQQRGVHQLLDRLRPLHRDDDDPALDLPVTYPEGDFGERLEGLVAMLQSGLPIRVATVTAPGSYDTHDDQEAELGKDLKETAEGLKAFQDHLRAVGLADRVVTLVWSEFGRRVEENGGAGTDHGAAGLAMVMGSMVRGGMLGEWTGLGGLDKLGNVRHSLDFRSLYSSLLEQWLGTDAAAIIPGAGGFARPLVIR